MLQDHKKILYFFKAVTNIWSHVSMSDVTWDVGGERKTTINKSFGDVFGVARILGDHINSPCQNINDLIQCIYEFTN